MKPNTAIPLAIVVGILVLAVMFQPFRFTTIQPGNVGIKVDLLGRDRQIGNTETVVGRVLYNTWSTQIVQYPYTTQRFEWYAEEALKFSSTEGVRLGADVAISLGVDPSKAADLYVKYRKSLDAMIDNEVRDRVNGCMNQVSSSMTVDQVIGAERANFLDKTLECINVRLVNEGFVLNDFQITSEFYVPDSIKAKIEEQIQAQQAAIAAENKVRQIEAEARQRVAESQGQAQARQIQAEAEASAKRIEAQAEADARLIQAKAEAEAIAVQGAAITKNPQVLQLSYLEKWNGTLPQVVGSEGFTMMLPVQNP
jgi:regulator of protease activity HflC (stomatin/prohibitin superfamily)